MYATPAAVCARVCRRMFFAAQRSFSDSRAPVVFRRGAALSASVPREKTLPPSPGYSAMCVEDASDALRR